MILARLKHETKSDHDKVEAQLGLLTKPMNLHVYRGLLCKFWGFYEPVEAHIAQVSDWATLGFNFNERRKTPLLERDLAALEVRREALDGCQCGALPDLFDIPHALGCLYVLEGATLGGQVIIRYLKNQAGGPYPTNFFASYGDDVGPKWKVFGDFLLNLAKERGGEDAIVQSARATFASLEAWLAEGEERA